MVSNKLLILITILLIVFLVITAVGVAVDSKVDTLSKNKMSLYEESKKQIFIRRTGSVSIKQPS